MFTFSKSWIWYMQWRSEVTMFQCHFKFSCLVCQSVWWYCLNFSKSVESDVGDILAIYRFWLTVYAYIFNTIYDKVNISELYVVVQQIPSPNKIPYMKTMNNAHHESMSLTSRYLDIVFIRITIHLAHSITFICVRASLNKLTPVAIDMQ